MSVRKARLSPPAPRLVGTDQVAEVFQTNPAAHARRLARSVRGLWARLTRTSRKATREQAEAWEATGGVPDLPDVVPGCLREDIAGVVRELARRWQREVFVGLLWLEDAGRGELEVALRSGTTQLEKRQPRGSTHGRAPGGEASSRQGWPTGRLAFKSHVGSSSP